MMSEAAMLENIAWRCALWRPKRRPSFLCRIERYPSGC
jgi:hypothetical protein